MIVNIEIMKLVDDRVHENIKRNGEDYVKKAAGLVLIGALSLGLAACGSSEEGEGAGANKSFEAKTIENVNGKAVVEVNYSGIGVYNLYNTVSDYKRAYYQETNEYDSKKQEAYAISKFKDILGGAELKESNYPLEIEMVEKDGKWEVKPKDKYSDTVEKAFAAGDIN